MTSSCLVYTRGPVLLDATISDTLHAKAALARVIELATPPARHQ